MSDSINPEELSLAQDALTDSQTVQRSKVSYYDPTKEVESSLVSLLRHRIEKLKDDVVFEQHIKDAILARLPEAQFAELIRILDTIQNNMNISVEKVLSPFIPRVGDRVPLLDTNDKKSSIGIDQAVFDKAPKEVIQSLTELARVLALAKRTKGDK